MKIFGIGLSRTGTLSLTTALRMLGYRAVHFPRSLAEIDANDASTDTTIAMGFEVLDAFFPGSKFIHTQRDEIPWLLSCREFFVARPGTDDVTRKVRMALYGTQRFDESEFRRAHMAHEARVANYFRDRPEDLLTLRVCAGEGWTPLCRFLNKPVPSAPFPHEHRDAEFEI